MKIDFLKSMPLFSSWTRDSLRRLTPFFIEKEYKVNINGFIDGLFIKYQYIFILLWIVSLGSNIDENKISNFIKYYFLSW